MALFFILSLVLKIGPRVLDLLGTNSTTKPLPQTSFLSVFLKTESYNVTQAGFELPVILPLPIECWNCRHTTFCFRGMCLLYPASCIWQFVLFLPVMGNGPHSELFQLSFCSPCVLRFLREMSLYPFLSDCFTLSSLNDIRHNPPSSKPGIER